MSQAHCRFVFLCDTHLRDPSDTAAFPPSWAYPLGLEKAIWALRWIAQPPDGVPVSFVIFGGDMMDGYIAEPMRDLRFLVELVERHLRVPIFPCLGNHENIDGRDTHSITQYLSRFAASARQYTFDAAGLRFIVLDTSDSLHDLDRPPLERTEFLRRELSRARVDGVKVVVVSHVPLCNLRDEAVLKESFGWATYRVLEPTLLAALEADSSHVVAVLSGHLHLSGMVLRAGVHHMASAGTSSYPADFIVLDRMPDRLDVRFVKAPKDLLDTAGNMHGHERHGRDFTDSKHPDRESYLWGNDDERQFSISLKP